MKNIFIYLLLLIVIVLFLITLVVVRNNRVLESDNKDLIAYSSEVVEQSLQIKENNNKLFIKLEELERDYAELEGEFNQIREDLRELESNRALQPSRASTGRSRSFVATAYVDNESCQGNWVGQTATGLKLANKTLQDKLIAVDPNVISLGSTVYIDFPSPYEHLNGNYTAVDVGGAIKGNKIDIFFGPAEEYQNALQFGRRNVNISW